jgi:hypothetical protein
MGQQLTGRINIDWPGATKESEFWAGGISVDQFIANRWGVEALTLGARAGGANGGGRISYRDAYQPVHPIEDPAKAFEQVFGDLTESAEQRAARVAQRRSVLDVAARQLPALQGRLPAADREKLELHLEGVRAIERKLGEDAVTCTPAEPGYPGGYDYRSNTYFPVTARRHIDVLVQALACGATRVASLQLGNTGASHVTPTWPDAGINLNTTYHNIAHDYIDAPSGEFADKRVEIEKWVNRYQFRYLLESLASIREGPGTMLDNTLVLWTKNIGHKHRGWPMLYMLAGRAGGALATGRYVGFKDVAHNQLLVSCCHLLGLDDVERFGEPDIGEAGPLSL